MTIREVQEASKFGLREGTSSLIHLGTHTIDHQNSTIWLHFDEDGFLTSYLVSQIDGWKLMSVRLTPKMNVCTGSLHFFVWISLSRDLMGAKLSLDGKEIDISDLSKPLELTSGVHIIQIEKDRFKPIVKQLNLLPGGRGDHYLDILGDDLVSIESQSLERRSDH